MTEMQKIMYETLFKEFPGITKLIFNGKESHKYFLKRFGQMKASRIM